MLTAFAWGILCGIGLSLCCALCYLIGHEHGRTPRTRNDVWGHSE